MKRKAPPKKGALQRAHLFFSGRVQGVGFRFTAERLALEVGLQGWVRNLPDQRVELLCEGPRDKIELFLERLNRSSVGPHIRRCVCEWGAASGEFDDFRVEYVC